MIRRFLKLLKTSYYWTVIYFTPNSVWEKYERLEIGAGPNKRVGWLTLDSCSGADVVWNLNRKLPFPDNCFDEIYSSHVLEHFSPSQLDSLLSELYRVLSPNGKPAAI